MTRLIRIRLTWLGLEVLSAMAHRLARWGGFDAKAEPHDEPSQTGWLRNSPQLQEMLGPLAKNREEMN